MTVASAKGGWGQNIFSRCNDVVTPAHAAFLLEHSNLLSTFMCELVNPVFCSRIKTAGVYFSSTGEVFDFRVNELFWKSLSFYTQCFVLAHEICHVLLKHISRETDLLDSMREQGLDVSLLSNDVLNILQDIEINEMLLSEAYGFARTLLRFAFEPCFVDVVFTPGQIEDGQIRKDEGFEYYAKFWLKYHSKMDLNALLARLFDDHMRAPDDHDPAAEDEAYGAIGLPIGCAMAGELVDEFLQEHGIDLDDITQNKFQPGGNMAGDGGGPIITTTIETARSLDDVFTLSLKKTAGKLKIPVEDEAWGALRLPLYDTMQRQQTPIHIPGVRTRDIIQSDKMNVLVYMDTSGSCLNYVKRLMELVASMPDDKFELETYVFADTVRPIDLDKKVRFNSGGTQIQKVYTHALERFEERDYAAVYVLSDGEFYGMKPDSRITNYAEWYWFLVPTYDKSDLPPKSTVYRVMAKDY